MTRRAAFAIAALVACLAGLAAWFGLGPLANAAREGSSASQGAPASAYDVPSYAPRVLYTPPIEGGPPAAHGFLTTYEAVDRSSRSMASFATGTPTSAASAYDYPATLSQVAGVARTLESSAPVVLRGPSISVPRSVAANGAGKIPWTSWQNYPKVTQGGREYAQVGDRLYTRHAVDRMQPSGLGAPAGATGPGRSISPNYIEDVLGSTKGSPVKGPNGEARLSYTSGTVQVITEDNIVITVITR